MSSCPLGLCIVDFDAGESGEVFHLSFGSAKTSNVAFGDGYLYVTGVADVEKGPARLWRLPLA